MFVHFFPLENMCILINDLLVTVKIGAYTVGE